MGAQGAQGGGGPLPNAGEGGVRGAADWVQMGCVDGAGWGCLGVTSQQIQSLRSCSPGSVFFFFFAFSCVFPSVGSLILTQQQGPWGGMGRPSGQDICKGPGGRLHWGVFCAWQVLCVCVGVFVGVCGGPEAPVCVCPEAWPRPMAGCFQNRLFCCFFSMDVGGRWPFPSLTPPSSPNPQRAKVCPPQDTHTDSHTQTHRRHNSVLRKQGVPRLIQARPHLSVPRTPMPPTPPRVHNTEFS